MYTWKPSLIAAASTICGNSTAPTVTYTSPNTTVYSQISGSKMKYDRRRLSQPCLSGTGAFARAVEGSSMIVESVSVVVFKSTFL